MLGLDPLILFLGLFQLVMLVLIGFGVARMYQKCGPNQAMIITGMWASENERAYKIVVGGGAVVLPVVQQRSILSLEPMTVKVKMASPVVTRDKVSITVDCVGQIKIKNDTVAIVLAAENLLGKTSEETIQIAQDIIGGHLRSLLLTVTIEELVADLSAIALRVREVSLGELNQMGLTLTTLSVTDIKDSAGRLYPF